MSNLSADQQNTLQLFKEVTQISDDYLSLEILQQNNWNLDLSLSQYINVTNSNNNNSSSQQTESQQPSLSSRSRQSNHSSSISGEPRNTQNIISDLANNNNRNSGNSNSFVRWLFQSRPVSLNPQRDTLKFIDDFNLQYRSNHPIFHPDSYQSAVALAFSTSKFLLVYLHSPIHEDTNRFCRQVLCSQRLTALASQYTVTWAGKIWDSEAYGLSSQLKATAYPFVALLVCQSNRMVQVAEKIQGYVEEEELCTRLQSAMNSFNSLVATNRAEAERRAEAVRLREQQDREYQESAQADRLAEERQRREAAEREAKEEERIQQEELEQAVELSKQLSHADNMRKKKDSLAAHPEPPLGPDIATVRFQLPKGTKLSRRFHKTDSAERIFEFLSVHFFESGDEIRNFAVSSHFPKMNISDLSLTIEALSLHPRGMLYVQDLDA